MAEGANEVRASYAEFVADGAHYAFPSPSVRQVGPCPSVTPLPLARAGLQGLALHEGRAVPVYRFAGLLEGSQLPGGSPQDEAAVCVLVQQGQMSAGFLFQRAQGLVGLEPGEHLAPADAADQGSVRFAGIISREGQPPVLVVDLEKTFALLEEEGEQA